MSDDAQFEAFLNGEGELAQGLQELAQPVPSAALDAAILASARAAMAQGPRPAAANDSGDSAATPQLARSLGWRWRMPAGIAAAVLVGVFAKQAFEASDNLHQVAPPEPAQAEAVMASPPALEAEEDKRAAAPAPEAAPEPQQKPVAAARPVVKVKPPVAAAVPMPMPTPMPAPAPIVVQESEVSMPAPAPAPMQAQREAPATTLNYSKPEAVAAPPAKAPPQKPSLRIAADAGAVADESTEEATRVAVTGRANKWMDAARSVESFSRAREAARPAAAPPPGPSGVMAEREWLDRIEKLLAQGRQLDAVAEWKAFREVYPNYPVPDATRSKLE